MNKIITFNWVMQRGQAQFPPYPFGQEYVLIRGENDEKFFITAPIDARSIIKKYSPPKTGYLGNGCMYYYGKANGFVLTNSEQHENYGFPFRPAPHEITKEILEKLFPGLHVSIVKSLDSFF